jgi:DNA-directed RNA polymerase subunit alpha
MIDSNFFTQKVKVSDNETKFIIEPLPMSFGHSLGNALRRTLLSSIKGAAVTQVKIDDCPHLFTTIKGVKESALEITMNLKQLRFKFEGKGPFKIKLQAKKKGKIYAKDIEGEVEVINKDLYLAEITDTKGKLDLEAVVEVGVGYLQAKEQTKKEFGYVPLDAFFSPVKKVNFKVEETRVGGKTNFDRLILEVATDGSVLPEQALREGTEILAGLFGRLLSGEDKPQLKGEKSIEQKQQEALDTKYSEIIIDELNLPSRIINALLREKIETVADLIRAGREKLSVMKGVGKKSIELIDEELKKMNIQL